MDFWNQISTLFATAGLLFSSFLAHPSHLSVKQQPTPSPIVTSNQPVPSADDVYSASKTISYQGYEMTMNIAVPKNGGKVTGSISGDCTGTIYGTYDGKPNGMLRGYADGSCQAFFLKIPGEVHFHGTVDKINKQADLTVDVKVESIEKSQNLTFSFK